MATTNLELTRNELIEALANTTDLDIISKMKRAYDRIMKQRSSEKNQLPIVGPTSYQEIMDRLDEAERDFETGNTISHDVVMEQTKSILADIWDMRMNPEKLKRRIK